MASGWSSIGIALTLMPLLQGCGEAPADQPVRARRPACRAPAGVSNQPQSIDETVALVNALPKPLTLPCFLESLARPLQLNASQSVFSAQPAVGVRSPRVFVFMGANIMSVVPDGVGAHLLEFGEQRPGFRSLKAELSFPILGEVAASEPYTEVLFADDLTECAFCHADETRDPQVPTAGFISQAIRPFAKDRVPLAALLLELKACDRAQEAERCAMLDALLGWGDSLEHEFPPEMPTLPL